MPKSCSQILSQVCILRFNNITWALRTWVLSVMMWPSLLWLSEVLFLAKEQKQSG